MSTSIRKEALTDSVKASFIKILGDFRSKNQVNLEQNRTKDKGFLLLFLLFNSA